MNYYYYCNRPTRFSAESSERYARLEETLNLNCTVPTFTANFLRTSMTRRRPAVLSFLFSHTAVARAADCDRRSEDSCWWEGKRMFSNVAQKKKTVCASVSLKRTISRARARVNSSKNRTFVKTLSSGRRPYARRRSPSDLYISHNIFTPVTRVLALDLGPGVSRRPYDQWRTLEGPGNRNICPCLKSSVEIIDICLLKK